MLWDGVYLRVAAPAEHGQLRFRQQRKDFFGARRLMLRPNQLDGRLMKSLAGGLTMLAQPAPHQKLKYGVSHMCQSDGADSPQLILRHADFEMVFHCVLLT